MIVPPAAEKGAFSCPHCGAYTSQTWFRLLAQPFDISKDGKSPVLPTYADLADKNVHNLHLSLCFACNELAIWVHDQLVFPTVMDADLPNEDLPPDVITDYKEASRIVSLSPRGAAALLRLAIQKLCANLGEEGKNMDTDIASLVRKGLLPVVQQSLDSLRVTGNEAVHPGTIDIKDDRETASQLFKLVNIIAEQMISIPKQANEVYSKLSHHKSAENEKRNGKK